MCGLSLVAASRGYTLAVVASLVVKHWFESARVSIAAACGLQSTDSRAMVHRLSCPEACGIFLDQGSNLCPLH